MGIIWFQDRLVTGDGQRENRTGPAVGKRGYSLLNGHVFAGAVSSEAVDFLCMIYRKSIGRSVIQSWSFPVIPVYEKRREVAVMTGFSQAFGETGVSH